MKVSSLFSYFLNLLFSYFLILLFSCLLSLVNIPFKDALLDFLVRHMPNPDNQSEAERRALYDSHLSQLKHWR